MDARAVAARKPDGRRDHARAWLCAASLLSMLLAASGVAEAATGQALASPAVASATTGTFGKTTVGAKADNAMFADYKIVHSATLAVSGSITKLSVYAIPGVKSPSPQALKAVIYSDSGGSPGTLLASGMEVTYRGDVNARGWLDLAFASPVALAPGTYWIGFITGSESKGMGYVYDVASGTRVYNPNTYVSGPTSVFGALTRDSEQASIYATYTQGASPSPPVNLSAPTISGTTQQGQLLTATTGGWTGSPTGYSYEWLRCDFAGVNCARISGASTATYNTTEADVGKTLRVSVIASNTGGPSAPATSTQTSGATGLPPTNKSLPTISGTAQVGQTLTANPATWTLYPTYYSYEWQRCDSAGTNCARISVASTATYKPTEADVGKTLRVSVIASNAGGPSAPATSTQTAGVTGLPQPPANTSPPTISGTASQGQTLTAKPGTWTVYPTYYSYRWERCDLESNCTAIASATSSSYTVVAADLNSRLRVAVVAENAGGRSTPAASAQTAVVTASTGVSHLEYVFNDGPVSVYDSGNGFKLVESFTLPGTSRGVRGVTVSPATHMMFVSYGGDGGPNGNGSVLAYDLVSKKIVWSVNLGTGVDSGAVSNDGKLLYMPDGELSSDGNWYILDTSNGNVIGKIETPGAGPHNTVMSADGKTLLLGARNYNYLFAYNTQTAKLQATVGPLVGGVRPNTINGSDSIGFTTATNFDGFQVESLTPPGAVLFTESFGTCTGPFSTCSHGISLSPDNRQVYVIDTVNKAVQVWDVHGVVEGVAPVQLAVVPVAGLQGAEQGCAYDCGRDGWLHHSLDGRYVFVGDSGEVIETATRKVITTLPTLANTRKFAEIDWQNGAPIASSGRQGVGRVP